MNDEKLPPACEAEMESLRARIQRLERRQAEADQNAFGVADLWRRPARWIRETWYYATAGERMLVVIAGALIAIILFAAFVGTR